MSLMTPREVVLAFVDRISHQDVDGLAGLMTEDHLFVDGGGQEARGREHMRQGWGIYYSWVPDYFIHVEQILVEGHLALLIGKAGGTYRPAQGKTENCRWEIPAAWKAVVRGNKVAEWRVYADNEPMYRLMEAYPPPE